MNIMEYNDISVLIEIKNKRITALSLELLGKAKELSKKVSRKLSCVVLGSDLNDINEELLNYGIDKIYAYENSQLEEYRAELAVPVVENFINISKPAVLLIPDNDYGKVIASRIAVKFKTGLTSGCTDLDIKENLDLLQIKPITDGLFVEMTCENMRPQIATVKKSVMAPIEKDLNHRSIIIKIDDKDFTLESNIQVLKREKREKIVPIEDAEVLIVAGQGIKDKKDLVLLEELAKRLNGQVAFTRPLVQMGWADHKLQVGISGKTVKPSLMITVGVSGAIQFVAGMEKTKHIIAINNDKNAPIFKVAHYGLVGDLYEVIPELINIIK